MPPPNCSICRNAQDHPRSSFGVYSCSHCTWETLSLARLKLHHFEKHSTDNEYAAMFTNRTQRDESNQEGGSANADRSVSSSEEDNSRQSPCSGSDPSVGSGVTESPRSAARYTGHSARGGTSRTSQVACPHCSSVCTSTLTLRLHHISVHDGIPFVDPTEENARKSSAIRSEGNQTRRKTMNGYQRDDFVCSDESSSSISYDEYSAGPDEASSDATVVSARTPDSSDSSDDETVLLSGNEEAVVCDWCHKQLSTKLELAVHLRRVHQVCVFCSYCGHGSRKAQLLRLHHRRYHHERPFKYLHLNNFKLVHVTEVDTDEWEEESADESTCLLAKLPEVSEARPRKAPRKKPSKAPQSPSKGLLGRARHAPSQERITIVSSSSEEEEVSSVEVVPSISRNVYFGFRCPKSVRAFQTLMDSASDVFKCSAFSCGYSTNVSSNFERHLAGHRLEDVFCMYCGANVPHPKALVTHLEQEHGDLRHQCLKCLYRAGFTPYFEVHFLQVHPGEPVAYLPVANGRGNAVPAPPADKQVSRPYECGFAGCSFKEKNRQVFTRHFEEAHAGASSFPCSVCDRSCKLVANLLDHLQDHGFADLECCYCRFGTSTPTSMMLHACYAHANRPALFAVRSSNLGEKFFTSSNEGPLSVVFSDDTAQLVSEQRCSFCPRMVAGFDNLQKHAETAHGVLLSPEELAERLFGMYDYMEALQLGRCPFCPYVGDRVTDLHEHVLSQELQISNFLCSACEHGFENQRSWQEHIDCGQCPATAMLQLCNHGQLVEWVHNNLPYRIQRFQCPFCTQTFRAASNFRNHLLRHYTYYPVTCKLCNTTCRGIRGRQQHLKVSHGTGGEDETDGEVDVEVARQAALCSLPEVRTCPHCGFRTVCKDYYASHVTRCAMTEHPPVDIEGSNSDSEEEDKPIYHCMHCSVSFIYLEPLLSHGYVQHGCSWFCTVCYQGYETELGCLQHCKDAGCKRPGTMFLVERAKKKTPGREFFYSEVTVDECAADLSGLSLGEQEMKAGFTYYNQAIEPIHRIGHTYVSAGRAGKISLPDFAQVVNIQPYVRVRDWKMSHLGARPFCAQNK